MSTEYIHATSDCSARSMSSESNEEIEKCEAREEEEVTLPEVIQRDKLMVDTANAVLGGISDTSCTYPAGYIRQVRPCLHQNYRCYYLPLLACLCLRDMSFIWI